MENGVRAECGGRLHSVRSRDGKLGRSRGRAASSLCRHDPRHERLASDNAAALLRPWPKSRGDRHIYASRTRFIPDELMGLFERTAWPVLAVAVTAGQSTVER